MGLILAKDLRPCSEGRVHDTGSNVVSISVVLVGYPGALMIGYRHPCATPYGHYRVAEEQNLRIAIIRGGVLE